MKKTSIIINTSRGEIINEVDLIEALESSHIAGAALDVIANEHINPITQSHPLIEYAKNHNNLIMTPHIGGATYESMYKTEVFMAKKLSEWIKSMNAGLN